jgi:hypothetical protein
MLLRHSTRLLFGLLCALVLMRLPSISVVEQVLSSPANMEEDVVVPPAVAPHAVGILLAPPTDQPPLCDLARSDDPNSCSIRYSILRL